MQALLLYAIKLSLEELSQDESISLRTFLIFGLALLALYKALSVAMDISSTIGRELVTSLELRITKSLSESSYLGVQTLSTPQVFEMLSGAKDIVNEACILLPVFISSTTMLFCALCFAMYISTVGLLP
jgi:ABC-type siderophore export system fused ATPase/permease subunit